MELALNLIWLSVAATGFLLVLKRSRRVWLVVACAGVLLFPIISASDDMNAVRTFNDAAAAIVVTIVLYVAFVAIAHLGSFPARVYVVPFATPSDPRSPPAR